MKGPCHFKTSKTREVNGRERCLIVLFLSLLPFTSYSQNTKTSEGRTQRIRIGVTGGIDHNAYSIQTPNYNYWDYEGARGTTFGVLAQFDYREWIAFRLEFNFAQKNHRQFSTNERDYTNVKFNNWYWQMPMMAALSYGGKKLRGIFNIGVYGAYWIYRHESGDFSTFCYPSIIIHNGNSQEGFNVKRDNRYDFGGVAGIGAEYHFDKHWAVQLESRCYYSLKSTTSDYMLLKHPSYNTTLTLQTSIIYKFNAFTVY